ncbi:sulfite exporter TauE/SafE family protein [Chitinivorax sp. B]|uniref:sulfite exporter TauE/SafE family protein n=1 Tax=Chitinivorax sp. B TaxID=2502235 RepID=UPI0020173F65|nr:sulfite exporter TauE/SafE family protein [Chitinivorax sp. B]
MTLFEAMTVVDNATFLLPAAFLAGALNAVAGGGSFLTLPALLACGIPPVAANATGTTALLPGYLASAWGFRNVLQTIPCQQLVQQVMLSLLGGAAGATLLLLTPDRLFDHMVPWLLLAATVLFAAGPKWLTYLRQHPTYTSRKHSLGLLVVSIYGGYFNGGLGIMLLTMLNLLGDTDLQRMNGVKNLLSATLTIIAVSLYALADSIVWGHALLMMLAATVGGYAGARLAGHIPAYWLRRFIVATGLAMTVLFFIR